MSGKNKIEKDPLEKRLECLILLNYLKDAPEKEKLKAIVNCIGLSETARLLGKDPGNLHRAVNGTKKNVNELQEEMKDDGKQ